MGKIDFRRKLITWQDEESGMIKRGDPGGKGAKMIGLCVCLHFKY